MILYSVLVFIANSLQNSFNILVIILVVDVPFLPKIVPFVSVLEELLIIVVIHYKEENRENLDYK